MTRYQRKLLLRIQEGMPTFNRTYAVCRLDGPQDLHLPLKKLPRRLAAAAASAPAAGQLQVHRLTTVAAAAATVHEPTTVHSVNKCRAPEAAAAGDSTLMAPAAEDYPLLAHMTTLCPQHQQMAEPTLAPCDLTTLCQHRCCKGAKRSACDLPVRAQEIDGLLDRTHDDPRTTENNRVSGIRPTNEAGTHNGWKEVAP